MNDVATAPVAVHGRVAPGFERVRAAFAANFARGDDYEEVGAALAVYAGGRQVVDLWGGEAAPGRAWQADTLVNVYSTTKGLSAIALAMLVEEGKLRYDDLVVKYWPEFGANGKERTTVAQLLSHQAGLSGFAEPTAIEDLYDWDGICARLARQRPFWTPGEKTSYHAMTWGFLAGELFRRASGGVTIGRYFAQRLAQPLGADAFIGLPAAEEPRVAPMIAPRSMPDLSALTQPPEALAALANPQLEPTVCNDRRWRAAELPAVNGQASARGLARIYGAVANGGVLDGVRILSEAGIHRMTQVQAQRPDLLLGFTSNWALGLCLNQFGMLGPEPDTFGHGGWGGSIGCANPRLGVGIGYVCNQMGAQLVGDPRGTALCQAIFESL